VSQVEIIRAALEAWNAGDRSEETLSRYCDPSVTLHSPFSEMSGEPYRGYAGLQRWMRDIDEQFSEWRIGTDDPYSRFQAAIEPGDVPLVGASGAIPTSGGDAPPAPTLWPLTACISGPIRSIGRGNTTVEFCSPPISSSVCR
jgi:SnoaL-like domain